MCLRPSLPEFPRVTRQDNEGNANLLPTWRLCGLCRRYGEATGALCVSSSPFPARCPTLGRNAGTTPWCPSAQICQRIMDRLTGWRWPLPGGQHRCWILSRDPDFATRAGRKLDPYARRWRGRRLRENEFVISADEGALSDGALPHFFRGACHLPCGVGERLDQPLSVSCVRGLTFGARQGDTASVTCGLTWTAARLSASQPPPRAFTRSTDVTSRWPCITAACCSLLRRTCWAVTTSR